MLKKIMLFLELLFLFIAVPAVAEVDRRSLIDLVLTSEPGIQIQLQVEHAKLNSVLDEISRKTNILFHYSILPDTLITSTCVGSQLETVLKCLFGHTTNLVFRYEQQPDKTFPKEVWVLGSTLGTLMVSDTACHSKIPGASTSQTQRVNSSIILSEQEIEQLIRDLTTLNPVWKSQIIADLARKAPVEHLVVQQVLENALSDPAEEVRVQALLGWVAREGDAAIDEIWRAMKDDSASVRIIAVDLSKDSALWQQALSDSDPSVQKIAKIKLESLAN